MSVSELLQVPYVQGTNLNVESISVGNGTPISNFTEATISTDMYFDSAGNSHLGPTGPMVFTEISDKIFVSLPDAFTGSTGATAGAIIVTTAVPTQFRPTTATAYGSAVLVTNGLAPNGGCVCSVSTAGVMSFKTNPGVVLTGTCVVLPQMVSYTAN
jgi:hypothetical protein